MRYNPLKFLNNTAKVQMMKFKVASQKGRFTKLKNEVQRLNHLVQDNLMLEAARAATYKANDYSTYPIAVAAIAEKYKGTADWGVLQVGNIIDLRAAFIIGEGIKVVKRKGAEGGDEELKWANEFLEYNNLDEEVPQDYAIEAEIEGKIALKLAIEETKVKDEKGKEKDDFQVSARYISWTDKQYKVKAAPQDYLDYQKLTWQPKDKPEPETLNAPNFVYKKFGGRISDPDDAAPKIMKCLTQIDDLSKALRDWREIDRIFAGPILNVKCENEKDVKNTNAALDNKNWKIDKIFVSTTEMGYVQLDIGGVESINKEIITLAKMISGTTGVPVHFLGFTDILKQVATAKNLMESVKASTSKERITWKGAYEEVLTKAMIMYNEKAKQGMSDSKRLDPTKIGIEIPFITEEQWKHLIEFYLPAAIAGKITDEALHEQIVGFDVEAEALRREEKDASELESLRKEAEGLRADLTEKELFGEKEG